MEREPRQIHRLNETQFQAALTKLHEGKLPKNFSDVVAHVQGTTRELLMYATAITECALRQNTAICVLQDILEKADVRYEMTPDGPVKNINRQEGATHETF